MNQFKLRKYIGIALTMTIFMFIANVLMWKLYSTIKIMTLIAYVAVFVGLLFLLPQYIERKISVRLFNLVKYIAFPLLIDLFLSYSAYNNNISENKQLSLQNHLHTQIEHKQLERATIVIKHNEIVTKLQNVDNILSLVCSSQSNQQKLKEREKLLAFSSALSDLTTQDSQYTVSELNNKNSLSCSKVFVQDNIKQLNEIRKNFIQLSAEQAKIQQEAQLEQKNSKILNNIEQNFFPFLKSYMLSILFAIFMNYVFNLIGIRNTLNKLIFEISSNDINLPRDIVLERLIPYLPNPNSVNRKFWEIWKWKNQRYDTYKKYRIIKLDVTNRIDKQIMYFFHTNAGLLKPKLLTESQFNKLIDLDLIDDSNIYENKYRYYAFKPKNFDHFFSYNSCLN